MNRTVSARKAPRAAALVMVLLAAGLPVSGGCLSTASAPDSDGMSRSPARRAAPPPPRAQRQPPRQEGWSRSRGSSRPPGPQQPLTPSPAHIPPAGAATPAPAYFPPSAPARAAMPPRGNTPGMGNVVPKSAFPWTDGKCTTGERNVAIAAPPMRLEDIAFIRPMGFVTEEHVTPIDHMYFVPVDINSAPDRYDVMAPAEGAIVAVQHRRFDGGTQRGSGAKDEYRIYIELSCSVWVYYDLVRSLARDVASKLPSDIRGTALVHIPVRAGQVIGKIGGQTLDFGLVDAKVTLPGFLVPEHYDHEPWKIHTVDPFDRMTEPLKTLLLAKNLRPMAPRGGKIDYDVDGKLVGNWFEQNTNGYAGRDPRSSWTSHLSIAYDHLDPSQIRVSLGSFAGRPRQFGTLGGPDPASVGPESGIVAYTLAPSFYVVAATGEPWDMRRAPPGQLASRTTNAPQGVLLVQMVGPRTLKMEAFPGAAAGTVKGFTANARLYER